MRYTILILLAPLAACGGGDPEPSDACQGAPYSIECPPPLRGYPAVPCPSQYEPNQLCQAPTVQPVHCDEQDCH